MPSSTALIRREHFLSFPFIFVDFPTEEALHSIINRSILVGRILDLYSDGKVLEEVLKKVDVERL